jgi:excisionase family DNA binding protein
MTACGTYTRAQVAAVLGVSVRTVERRIAAGQLPVVGLGGRVVRLPAPVIDRIAAGQGQPELEAAGQ